MGKKNPTFYVDIQSHSDSVTGSSYRCMVKYPDGEKTEFLLDAGVFQDKDSQDLNREITYNTKKIKFVLISHAHTDHIGKLPYLVKKGVEGSIYASEQTKKLIRQSLVSGCKIIRRDAKKNGQQPLYKDYDVDKTMKRIVSVYNHDAIQVDPRVKVTFFTNGHIFGSSLILIQASYPGEEDINVLFTGDYNDKNLLFDVPELPDWVKELPLNLITESTYGDRKSDECQKVFDDNIIDAVKANKNILVLVFSLGRAQEILYQLRQLKETGAIPEETVIGLDGELAINYTKLVSKEDFGEGEEKIKKFIPENLIEITKANRNLIFSIPGNKIIISTSGNGSFGPGHNYIMKMIEDENALIHFTGYIPDGSLGKRLKKTEFGEKVIIDKFEYLRKAQIEYTKEFSAHAHVDQLLKFIASLKDKRSIMITHGTPEIKEMFMGTIHDELDYDEDKMTILNRQKLVRITNNGIVKIMNSKL